MARWTTRIAGQSVGGGGGGTLAGDVTGPLLTNTVVAIQGTPVSAAAPAPGDVLLLVAGVWTPSPAAGGGTLQTAYAAGNTIMVTAANGVIAFDNSTDATDVLSIDRTFAGAGVGIDVNMGPGGEVVTGNGVDIAQGVGAIGTALNITDSSTSAADRDIASIVYSGGAAGGRGLLVSTDAVNQDGAVIARNPGAASTGGNVLSVLGNTNAEATNRFFRVGNSDTDESISFDYRDMTVDRDTSGETFTLSAGSVELPAAAVGTGITITAGDGTTIGAGGAIVVDAGASPSGTAGVIDIGETTASAISIGGGLGATEDLTLSARSGSITLNEAGATSLDAAFTATSVIGALNELIGATKELFFFVELGNNLGDVRIRNVTASAGFRFSFVVPADFSTLVSIELIGAPDTGANGAGKDIDLFSDYGAVGEQHDTHSESDIASTYTLPAVGEWFALDVSGVFSVVAAGDICGVRILQNAVGGIVHYLGIRLRYTVT